MREIWRRFKKNKPAMLGLIILVLFALVAIFADVIVDVNRSTQGNVRDRLSPPSAEHPFGTDHLGRDLFARVIHGSRISLTIGIFAVGASMVIGSFLGAAAGYYGGIFDNVLMRLLDVLNCIPSVLLTLAMVGALGPSMFSLLVALAISAIPIYVRMVRANVISLTDMEYIQAARAFGSSDAWIIIRHVLPNALGPIIIQSAGLVAATILAAASLSFLGFGGQPPTAEWGSRLSDARSYMRDAPYLMIFPGIAIVVSAMSIALMGDGLRDALDPRLRD
jgi:peptide/nickel transport system permease protein